MRKAFTLIEMIISITILSIMLIFLYKSYTSLNSSNLFYKKKLDKIEYTQKIKKMIYLDFTLIIDENIKILNQEKNEDVVMFQSSSSFHKKYNPYITYLIKNSNLYRLESLKPFLEYQLEFNHEFVAENLGKVKKFRVYESDGDIKSYLIDIEFEKIGNILLKINKLS